MTAAISLASVVTDDIVGLAEFYATTFDLPEVTELRSDIFRGLDVGGVTLGFSTPVVYELLHIERWSEATGTKQYLTFEVADDAAVDAVTATAVANGAELRHEPLPAPTTCPTPPSAPPSPPPSTTRTRRWPSW